MLPPAELALEVTKKSIEVKSNLVINREQMQTELYQNWCEIVSGTILCAASHEDYFCIFHFGDQWWVTKMVAQLKQDLEDRKYKVEVDHPKCMMVIRWG